MKCETLLNCHLEMSGTIERSKNIINEFNYVYRFLVAIALTK